jgi:hypothetical protein
MRRNRTKNSIPKPFIPLPPQIDYPDNKNIDPYDPATFGYVEVGIVTGAHGAMDDRAIDHGLPLELCKREFVI